jgi:hypothetical protein
MQKEKELLLYSPLQEEDGAAELPLEDPDDQELSEDDEKDDDEEDLDEAWTKEE